MSFILLIFLSSALQSQIIHSQNHSRPLYKLKSRRDLLESRRDFYKSRRDLQKSRRAFNYKSAPYELLRQRKSVWGAEVLTFAAGRSGVSRQPTDKRRMVLSQIPCSPWPTSLFRNYSANPV